MDILSPRFLFGALKDEICESLGVYPGGPASHRCHFLDHRALGLAADGNGGLAYVMWGRTSLWRPEEYLRSGSAFLWLRTQELELFAAKVLPRLEHRIVLVTSDYPLGPLRCAPGAAEAILASDKVIHWFCAQSDIAPGIARHTPMPLGLAYPYRNDIFFGDNLLALAVHQTRSHDLRRFERRARALLAGRKKLADRKFLAMADFALADTSRNAPWGETRSQIRERLAGNALLAFPERLLRQFDLYDAYGDHAFVVSPHGRGLDCYRTWEAIFMGAIPIVKRSTLDPVFRDFPVAIVDDWSEITARNLADWADRFAHAWDDGSVDEKLTTSYWTDRIRGTHTPGASCGLSVPVFAGSDSLCADGLPA